MTSPGANTLKHLADAVGGLSHPSKMPSVSWNLSPDTCRTGSLLSTIPGSVCAGCYAKTGNYRFSCVKTAQARRLKTYQQSPDKWERNMIEYLIRRMGTHPPNRRYFRWFDCGDITDPGMLIHIVNIAEALSFVKFWLPTKELAITKQVLRQRAFPANLAVRLSAPMVDQVVTSPTGLSSMVFKTQPAAGSFTCPATMGETECGECRECWDKSTALISYRLH